MSLVQITAAVIFMVMFVLIVTEKIERQWSALLCGITMIVVVFMLLMRDMKAVVDVLAVKTIFKPTFWYQSGAGGEESLGINWATVIFLAGMMVMVEFMAYSGFFRWLCLRLAKAVNYKPFRIFVVFMVMSAFLAMFIDSITVILFLATVTIEIARLLSFDPVPVIIAEIFCANLGGSATMCGDPPNIVIGTSFGYSFFDFLVNTGPIAVVGLIVVLIYFSLHYKKYFKNSGIQEDIDEADLDPRNAITNKRDFTESSIIFAIAVVLLVSHASTGLTVATIGLGIAIITMIAAGKDLVFVLKKVDYKTLLFFIGLFVVVGGLEITGILEIIAGLIAKFGGGKPMILITIVIWISAIASAFVDNIPFAATMVPIIKTLSVTQGIDLHTLSWTLALGTDIGGCATPIGASANVVGVALAGKSGHPISWKKFCTASFPLMVIVVSLCTVFIFVRYL